MSDLSKPILHTKEEQKQMASKYMNKELKLGDKWYLINSDWFNQWCSFVDLRNDLKTSQQQPSIINNKCLLDSENNLKENLIEQVDYYTVPEELWTYLVNIYSLESENSILERLVINDSMDEFNENLKIEIRKLKLNLEFRKKTIQKEISRKEKLSNLDEMMREWFEIPSNKKSRLFFRANSSLTLINTEKKEETLLGLSCGMGDTIVIDILYEDNVWLMDHEQNIQNIASSKSSQSKTDSTLSNSIPAPPAPTLSGLTTRSSTRNNYEYSYSNRHNDYKPGLCGLSNLGNTCFMNSAIQCMSNVTLLTDYFRQGLYKDEINTTNPLGCKGELAEAYANLINEIWSGENSYTIPRNFKLNLSRFAPQFTGFQQQDSQELLAFLLDGLHEDLNRIIKKPYIELGSHVGKTDEQFAEESWQDHKKRNDSIIVDTFHGLLKSTLNCLVCGEISIKFDPFCYLSVPLPSKKERLIQIIFVPLDSSKPLTKYKVSVIKNGTMLDLCASLEALLEKDGNKLNKTQMIVCDVYSNKFFKTYEPSEPLSSIREQDDIYVYELYSNYSNNDFYKLRLYLSEKTSAYLHSSSYFGLPLFLMIPKSVTYTYGQMYQLVRQNLKRFLNQSVVNQSNNYSQSSESEINSKLNNSLNVNDQEPINESQNGDLNESNSNITDHDDDEDIVTDSSQTNLRSSTRLKEKAAKKSKLFYLTISRNENSDYDAKNVPNDDQVFEWPDLTIQNQREGYSSFSSSSSSNQILTLTANFDTNLSRRVYNKKSYEDVQQHSSCSSQLIKKKDVISLSDCFSLYTKIEELSEQDYWYCSKCKQHQRSTKKFDLWKMPKVLVVHLKRFSYSRLYRDKIDSLVEFPLTNLDMANYLINKNAGETRYNLIAVSNHYGSLGGGHYTAYGQNRCDGRWYYFDDSSVSSSDESSVCTNAAYMLVYLRKDLHETTISNNRASNSDQEQMDH